MRVWSQGRGAYLPVRVCACVSFWCRLRGLTFRRTLLPEEALLLVGRREGRLETTIHMLFVFFPIAVLWLNGDGVVVDTCLARPFRLLYAPHRPARDVLEGPPDLLGWVGVGDRLLFEPC